MALHTSFKFNNNTHTCDTAEIEITYCSFYQSRDYSYLIINSPSLYTGNTGSGISPSIIFIEIDEIQNICNILSDENIKLSIDKHLAEQTQIDQILN